MPPPDQVVADLLAEDIFRPVRRDRLVTGDGGHGSIPVPLVFPRSEIGDRQVENPRPGGEDGLCQIIRVPSGKCAAAATGEAGASQSHPASPAFIGTQKNGRTNGQDAVDRNLTTARFQDGGSASAALLRLDCSRKAVETSPPFRVSFLAKLGSGSCASRLASGTLPYRHPSPRNRKVADNAEITAQSSPRAFEETLVPPGLPASPFVEFFQAVDGTGDDQSRGRPADLPGKAALLPWASS